MLAPGPPDSQPDALCSVQYAVSRTTSEIKTLHATARGLSCGRLQKDALVRREHRIQKEKKNKSLRNLPKKKELAKKKKKRIEFSLHGRYTIICIYTHKTVINLKNIKIPSVTKKSSGLSVYPSSSFC